MQKNQGEYIIDIQDLDIETREWFKGSKGRLTELFSRKSKKSEQISKIFKYLIWNVDLETSNEDYKLIQLYLNEIGLNLTESTKYSHKFRNFHANQALIHVEVYQKPESFWISAHIDIECHSKVLYNEQTSRLLSELGVFLIRACKQSRYCLRSESYSKKEKRETPEFKDYNTLLRESVNKIFLSKYNQLIDGIVILSLREKHFINRNQSREVIWTQFKETSNLNLDNGIIVNELDDLIERSFNKLCKEAKQRYENKLRENNFLKSNSQSIDRLTIFEEDTQKSSSNKSKKKKEKKKKRYKLDVKEKLETKRFEKEKDFDPELQRKNIRIKDLKEQIVLKFYEVLDEYYENAKVRDRTAININNIRNTVRDFFRNQLPSRQSEEKKLFLEAFKILDSPSIQNYFGKRKEELNEEVDKQLENKRKEDMEFNTIFKNFRNEVFSSFYSKGLGQERYDFKKKEMREQLITSLKDQNEKLKDFHYLDRHVDTFKNYLYSEEFDEDYKRLIRDLKKEIKWTMKSYQVKKKQEMIDKKSSIKWVLGIIVILIIIYICVYFMMLMNPL